MDDRPSLAARAAIWVGAPVGFLLAVSANPHTNDLAALALVALVLGAGLAATRWLPSNRVLAVLGGAGAATAAWLLPQRDDTATVLIIAFVFALGVGLAVAPPPRSRAGAIPALVSLVVVLGLRFTVSQSVLLTVVAIAVVAGALATAFGRFPTRAPSTRGRAVAFGAVFVIGTLALTGYLGAETPDATWFGGGTVHGPTGTREVALTFDDGPNVGATRRVMAILDDHGVKGTFFEVGKAIDADPQITRALYDDGHLLGNHSYEHDQWRWLDPRYPELQRTQAAFQRAIGTCPVLYRPPHGDRTPFLARVVRDHHMHMVLWSESAGDWATKDAQLVARRVLDQARPGAIILLHDGLDGDPTADRDVIVRALPTILEGLRARGLTPVRLDTLLGTAAYQPC